jgi:hypothetical protein
MTQFSTKFRMTAMAVLVAFCMTMMASTGAMAAKSAPAQNSAFVQGTNAAGDIFSGVVTITNFAVQNGQLVANGVLNGTLTPAGGVAQAVTNLPVTLPVSSASASCPILNLVLGPLSLDILGLTINLNQVVLNITAIPGAGNLLGNLLCAVANLLNGGNLSAVLAQLTILLNQILAAL